MSIESEIDRLYQLAPGEFTAARNELAKKAGTDASRIRRLTKPPLAAWAVNQLYWKDRETYDALIESAEVLRATHKAVMSGKRGDLRAAGKEHDEAVDRALKATLAMLSDSGHPVTDATRQAVGQTLRALPSAEPPGRLSHGLQPGGFDMLAGITAGRGARAVQPKRQEKTQKDTAKKAGAPKAEKEKEKEKAAREEAAVASREVRTAEQAARRAEFESARAARSAAKAEEELTTARQVLADARKRLEDADAAAEKAQRQRELAERAAAAADRDVATAKRRARTAQDQLDRLTTVR